MPHPLNSATSPSPVATARTFLFVPGNRSARFDKALRSGADAVVIDLEDSVPAAEKATSREAIASCWSELAHGSALLQVPLFIRTNAVGTPEGRLDLAFLKNLGGQGVGGVLLPKAESADDLRVAGDAIGPVPLIPLIESAAGWAALDAIAAAPGVVRLAIGHIDFMADTGISTDAAQSELAPLRFAVAMATRLHRLAPAIDGVTVDIGNDDLLHDDVARALRFGFGAKLCIHPRQVAEIHRAMEPADHELDWAQRVIAATDASGGAAVQLDGKMVDEPVIVMARRLLARASASRTDRQARA